MCMHTCTFMPQNACQSPRTLVGADYLLPPRGVQDPAGWGPLPADPSVLLFKGKIKTTSLD